MHNRRFNFCSLKIIWTHYHEVFFSMIVLYKKADFHCSFKKNPVKISVSKRTTIWSFIYQHHYKPPIKKNLFNAYSSTFSILWGNTNKKVFTINYDYLHLYTFRRNQKNSEQNQPSYTHLRFKAHNSKQRIKAKPEGMFQWQYLVLL